MLIARCISALRGGPANETGRSPLSDSPVHPSLTPPVLHHQHLPAAQPLRRLHQASKPPGAPLARQAALKRES